MGVDLDAFVAAHNREWSRLEHLARQGSPSGAEADEILDLYQRVATHLSVVRSAAPDPSLVTYLSSLLARARTRSAGTRSVAWSDLRGFFTDTFPAALYRTRRWWILTALVNLGASLVIGGMLVTFLIALGSAWMRGLDITCGCFGHGSNKSNYLLAVLLDAALLASLCIASRRSK